MSIKKIMTASPDEFFRSLAHLAPNLLIDKSLQVFRLPVENGAVTISFQQLPVRRVTGLLSLPQLEVTIEVDDLSPSAQQTFMNDFDLAFRRGGG